MKETAAAAGAWKLHTSMCGLTGLYEAGTLPPHTHIPVHIMVPISCFLSLHLPASLPVSSSMSPARLYLCHCVHICLSVALLVFKGPKFIWFHYHFPSLEPYLFVFSPFLIIIYMQLGHMLEMKCEFDKAAMALTPSHGLKAPNPLEKSRLFFFFSFFS